MHGRTVLYAVESGSRAWGFESMDSDFDVRFIHLSPAAHYLRVFPARDVIENDDVKHEDALLDFSGWDLQKLLQLATRSNPAVFEWLQSSLIYREDRRWANLRPLLVPFFSPCAAAHHYLSMARHNYREHMRDGQAEAVRLKKYLYITRPLLCLRWIEANPCSGPPPMPFNDLLTHPSTPQEIVAPLAALVERKRGGQEVDEGKPIPVVNAFIDAELTRWREHVIADSLPKGTGDVETLNRWFVQTVLAQ